jgi:hypothetical protein
LNPNNTVFVLEGYPKDWWIDENQFHGSAWDWNYLFEDEDTKQPVYIIKQPENNKDYLYEDSFLEGVFLEDSFDDKDILNDQEDSLDIEDQNITGIVSKNPCISPWWEYLAHWDFILAYQQRRDVTNLCNVQKRYCNDWELNWTYIQKSCKENTLYSYIKPEAISYTKKPIDPFIQPSKPSLSWADFDIHWKIDTTTNPIDVWYGPSTGKPSDINYIDQENISQKSCISPWWEVIPNGQFVKAYKSSIWLLDLPCDVEIRLCVWWSLKGSYINRTCNFKKMTYRDYLVNNYDVNDPTIWDLINSIATEEEQTTNRNSRFWRWLDKYF